jgi:hypothetical protein
VASAVSDAKSSGLSAHTDTLILTL